MAHVCHPPDEICTGTTPPVGESCSDWPTRMAGLEGARVMPVPCRPRTQTTTRVTTREHVSLVHGFMARPFFVAPPLKQLRSGIRRGSGSERRGWRSRIGEKLVVHGSVVLDHVG